MDRMLLGRASFRNFRPLRFLAVGIGLLMMFVLGGTAFGQQTAVTGTVTTVGGAPLPGVLVRVQGTDTRVVTDGSGRYRIAAPADAVLTFSLVGQKQIAQPVPA